ncbi:MAG: L-aspartate oxidase, partial [Candidatus Diapherotrites archaeon CG11_big_fil_rev_8_21_14_0_20_37_9]
MEKFDVIIAGSGIAGLSAALECAKTKQVVVIERGIEKTSNSYYAQGGIATAIGKNDSWEKHFEDTLKAGDGLCNVETVETITRNGPAAVKELINLGLVFDGESEPELGLEGGHSKNRVLHIKGDRTGKEMTLFLKKIAKENKNIDFIENTAVKKIYANKGNYSGIETNEGLMQSDSMVLATGGYAACFEKTTNPKTTTGLGMAIAIETGCEIWGMEFVQFHPTTIQTTIGNFLVTEAVRGEGGQIVNEDNEQIVNPLFTRDKVSRAIYREQLQGKKVFLDATEFNSGFFKKRFPSVYKELIANS